MLLRQAVLAPLLEVARRWTRLGDPTPHGENLAQLADGAQNDHVNRPAWVPCMHARTYVSKLVGLILGD